MENQELCACKYSVASLGEYAVARSTFALHFAALSSANLVKAVSMIEILHTLILLH